MALLFFKVLIERLVSSCDVMSSLRVALGEQVGVDFPKAFHPGTGHQNVATRITHEPLHTSFFMALPRVAEPRP